MGQRLVITVRENKENICKIYYHWSAYTTSAIREAKSVIDAITDSNNLIKDMRLRLIKFCEDNGGGIDGGMDGPEWKRIAAMYPNESFNSEDISRNNGLIAISEEGMEQLQLWSEGDIVVDIDAEMVYNTVVWLEDEFDTYAEDDEKDTTNEKTELPEIRVNIEEFSFSEIDMLLEDMNNIRGYYFKSNGIEYSMIA